MKTSGHCESSSPQQTAQPQTQCITIHQANALGFLRRKQFSVGKTDHAVRLSCPKASRKAGGDILRGLSFMRKAFSQNGRRNIAVVVDLLSFSETRVCAIAVWTVTLHREKWALFNGEYSESDLDYHDKFCDVALTLAHKITLIYQLIYTILTIFNFEKIRFWKVWEFRTNF